MAGFGNLVQKAFYLGVGIAAAAGERAGGTLSEVRGQAQKLVDELVEKGEMTTDEARKLVEDLVQQGEQQSSQAQPNDPKPEPRRIEIIADEEEESAPPEEQNVDKLRQQVQAMQEELRRLKR